MAQSVGSESKEKELEYIHILTGLMTDWICDLSETDESRITPKCFAKATKE